MTLVGENISDKIGPRERSTSTNRLQIDSPPATCAIVDGEVRVGAPQLISKRIKHP